ncbi:MAG: hypothetical protein GF329_14680 [Candidatus Lokiarchaeota archaeon]|nr:hypothetical protein [Candidatus Lokiarchaeota archaeon]
MDDKKNKNYHNKIRIDNNIDYINKKDKELMAIEDIIEKHVLEVNKKYHSDVFPSSVLTKVVMKELDIKNKHMFRIYHKKVKTILKKWEKKNYCEFVDNTHYAHCKKSKEIYQFPEDTFYRFNIYKMIPIV